MGTPEDVPNFLPPSPSSLLTFVTGRKLGVGVVLEGTPETRPCPRTSLSTLETLSYTEGAWNGRWERFERVVWTDQGGRLSRPAPGSEPRRVPLSRPRLEVRWVVRLVTPRTRHTAPWGGRYTATWGGRRRTH